MLTLLLTGCVTSQRRALDAEYRSNPHALRVVFITFATTEAEARQRAENLTNSPIKHSVVEQRTVHFKDGYAVRTVVQYDMTLPLSEPEPTAPKPSFD